MNNRIMPLIPSRSTSLRTGRLRRRAYAALSPLLVVVVVSVGALGGCAPDTSKLSAGSNSGKGGKGGASSSPEGGDAGSEQGGTGGELSTIGPPVGGSSSTSQGGTSAGGTSAGGTTSTTAESPIHEVVDVGLTYSGQPTDMALITVGNQQFVGYWGGEPGANTYKYLTVASRVLGGEILEAHHDGSPDQQ
ncbi:MAG: hypothetical protein QM784_01950 [Polyangiaceae bacterium]